MTIVVSVTSPHPSWQLPPRFVDRLRETFPQHAFVHAPTPEALRRALPQADAALTPGIDRDLFPRLQRVRWIQSPSVGVAPLLFPALVNSPVVVTNARGVRSRAVAEYVIGIAIALARRLHVAMRQQARGDWAPDLLEGSGIGTLEGRRIGIVGLGSIGCEVARLAAAFGLRVSAVRRRAGDIAPPEGTDRDDDRRSYVDEVLPADRLDEMLARSDIIVLCAPLTHHTRHLIGTRSVAAMKRGALLINVGRGALIDDDAVMAGLRDGRIGGAALDVFETEPLPRQSPWWQAPNVIVTPHVSGAMEDYWTPLIALFAENIRRYDAGAPLVNVVDKRAGY